MRTERKKHVTQMTASEIQKLKEKLRRLSTTKLINNIKKNEHLQKRLKEKKIGIGRNLLINRLEADIIEYKVIYNKGHKQERIVIRSGHCRQKDIILVINLQGNMIVTAWANHKADKHQTLNINSYDEKLKII